MASFYKVLVHSGERTWELYVNIDQVVICKIKDSRMPRIFMSDGEYHNINPDRFDGKKLLDAIRNES